MVVTHATTPFPMHRQLLLLLLLGSICPVMDDGMGMDYMLFCCCGGSRLDSAACCMWLGIMDWPVSSWLGWMNDGASTNKSKTASVIVVETLIGSPHPSTSPNNRFLRSQSPPASSAIAPCRVLLNCTRNQSLIYDRALMCYNEIFCPARIQYPLQDAEFAHLFRWTDILFSLSRSLLWSTAADISKHK